MGFIKFTQSTADPCVFIKTGDMREIIIVAVYIDDLIIITKTPEKIAEIKSNLSLKFKMKDLGKLHQCLGMIIEHDEKRRCLWLHQKLYILTILEKFGLTRANTVSTPANLNVKLRKDDETSKLTDPTHYQSIVGSLLYTAIATWPDMSQAVGARSKYCLYTSEAHLIAVKRILCYLKETVNLALKYEKSVNVTLVGYSDPDWAGDPDDCHSTTGNIFIMAGGAVSWFSRKQPMVALLTAEPEYVSLRAATQEAVWLKRLLSDFNTCPEKPTVLEEDNQGSIAIAKNLILHSRTKHNDIRYHYIHEATQNGSIDLEYCPTELMVADLLTKPLSQERFETLHKAVGLEPFPVTCSF